MEKAVRPVAAALVATVLLCFFAGQSLAAWTSVGNGIEYQQFDLSGPTNHVFVARMDRANTSATLETSMPYGKINGTSGTQIVRSQAANYDEALSWWGQSWGGRNDVIVAVNGDFWNTDSTKGPVNVPVNGQCHSGWYSRRMYEWGGQSAFAWDTNRNASIGGCTHHLSNENTAYFPATGVTLNLSDVNVPRGTDQLVLYTPQFDTTTGTTSTGTEVLIEVERPTLIMNSSSYVKGWVREVRQNLGPTYIPFDHVVLSASGNKVTDLVLNSTIGAEVRFNQYPKDYNQPDIHGQNGCNTPTGMSWNKTFAAIGCNYQFLKDGAVRSPDPAYSGFGGLVIRNPRTAIAYNASYVFFIVVDGRSAGGSAGMTMDELASFCINYLSAANGTNIDGGGSSTMVVNGTLKNVPSNGSERAVANGIMMVNILPKQQTTKFATGQAVTVNTNGTNVRMGPGTNYGARTTKNSGAQGTILTHSLSGVLAKGYNWWKVDFGGGDIGWVAETLLNSGGTAPSITSHPSAQAPCPGASAGFTVGANGTAPLSYQWQENGSDLSNGGHYSNVTTPTLTVSNCDASDVANYRCVVTNSYGNATSNAASLSLTQSLPGGVTITDEGAWTPSLTALSASWTPATPGACFPLNRYEYAVGTSPTTQNTRGWTSAGTSTSVTDASLTLADGQTYYVQVRAVDNGGQIGPATASNGITVAPAVDTIGSAWTLANSVGLSLRGKVVTAALGGAFWIEETDRTAAIKVMSSAVVVRGSTVSVAGTLGNVGTQRVLFGDVVISAAGSTVIPPLGLVQRSLGGQQFNASTPGVTGSTGLYNIGLLVRCAGMVTHVDSANPLDQFFYFDDGSGLSDGGPYSGVKVRCGSVAPPALGAVTVTGIVASEQVGSKVVPVILIRDANDVLGL